MADSRPLLLEVEHLCKWFPLKRTAGDVLQRKEKRYLKAVNDVSFQLFKGENLGLVGESGCGKSTLARTILRLYEPTSGTIRLNGTDISHMKGDALRRLRPQMQMIFQDPYSSLNPRMSVYDTIAEMLRVHKVVPAEELPARVEQLLTMSGLTAFPVSSPAASASASALPGPSPSTPPLLWRTSLYPPWTYPSRPRSSICLPSSSGIWS